MQDTVKRAEPSSDSTRPWLGLAIALAVILMLVGSEVASDTYVETEVGIAAAIVLVGLISGFMVAKRPGHPISWLLTFAAFTGGFAGLGAELLPPGLTQVTWWQAVLSIISGPAWYALLFTVLVLIPLLFPTGSPTSPAWRWVGWLGGAALAVISLMWMTQEFFCTDLGPNDGECLARVDNPIGITGMANPEEEGMGGIFFGLMMLCAVAALVSMVIRFRRSGTVQRHQIKWVAFSLGLFFGFILIVDMLWIETLGHSEPPGYWVLQQMLWVLIPASIAVAILRYRLYDIDRIVSRTVSYAVIALVLAAVYVGGVLSVQTVLPASDNVAVAASTLVAAALFSPLRRRVQRWVDRRFNRSRYDTAKIIDAFGSRLRDAVDLSVVTRDLGMVVEETVAPATAAVWLRGEAPAS